MRDEIVALLNELCESDCATLDVFVDNIKASGQAPDGWLAKVIDKCYKVIAEEYSKMM